MVALGEELLQSERTQEQIAKCIWNPSAHLSTEESDNRSRSGWKRTSLGAKQ